MAEVLLQAVTASQTQYQVAPWLCAQADVAEIDAIGDRIARLTLSREDWAAIRRNHRPPQEWFDDEDDIPFER